MKNQENRLAQLEIQAISFIQTVAKNSKEPLYAGNSGGKDSAVLDFLLQKSGITYISQYANTTIDPQGTISHIRKYYPHTKIVHPEESFYQLVERKGLPTKNSRFCCEILKEYLGIGKSTFEGVRSDEGTKRKGRDYISCDTRKSMQGAKHIYPIYDWTEHDIWAFINYYKIPVAPIYSKGCKRLGCVGCPLVTKKGQRQFEFDLHPKIYNAIKKAITKGMAKNPQWLLSKLTGGDGQLAMNWWLSGKSMKKYFTTSEITGKVGNWKVGEKRDLFNSNI